MATLLKSSILVLLITIVAHPRGTNAHEAHSCYVCADETNSQHESIAALRGASVIPTCKSLFEDSARVGAQFKCPLGYFGCQTRKQGVQVSRSCAKFGGLNDCQVANLVKFCLCSGSLCNDNQVEQWPPYKLTRLRNIDDEDLYQPYDSSGDTMKEFGSGTSDRKIETTTNKFQQPDVSVYSNACGKYGKFSVLVTICLVLTILNCQTH